MVAPFGFSAGDFLAAIILLKNVVQALSESRGPTASVRSVVQLLSTISAVITESQAIFVGAEAAVGISSPSILNGIIAEPRLIHGIVDNFLKHSRTYTESIVQNQGSRAKKEWKKISWYLFRDNDIQKLENSLQSHLLALSTYNAAHLRVAAMANLEALSRVEATFDSRMQTLSTQIDNLNILPKQLGWIWEGDSGPLDAPVRVFDLFGAVVPVPLVFLSTPKIFHDILKILYRETPGRLKIIRNEYTVTDEDSGGNILDESNWSSSVKPGMRVSLNVVLKAAASWKSRGCPKCKSQVLEYLGGAGRTNRLRRCRTCHFVYRVRNIEIEQPNTLSAESKDLNGKQGPEKALAPVTPMSSLGLSGPAQSLSSKNSEEGYFQRVHYFREVVKRPVTTAPETPDSGIGQKDGKHIEKTSPLTELDLKTLPDVHRAAASGDLKNLKSILAHQMDAVDSPASDSKLLATITVHGLYTVAGVSRPFELIDFTPLHFAVLYEHPEITEFLITKGADTDSRAGRHGDQTALMYASQLGDQASVKLLVVNGASSRIQSKDGKTALTMALRARKNATNISKTLLEATTDLHQTTTAGHTALMVAAQTKNDQIVDALLDKGAFINAQDTSGDTALICAVDADSLSTTRKLIERGAALDLQEKDGCTALMLAVYQHKREIAELLIAAGGDLSRKTYELGFTAVMIASQENQVDVMPILLARNPSLNDGSTDIGSTVLMLAASKGHTAIAEQLLSAGADPNVTTRTHGLNALIYASRTGKSDIVGLLIKYGAKIDHNVDDCGWTALQSAAWYGFEEVVEMLLDHGAKLDLTGEVGRSALYMAAENGHDDTVRLLLNRGASPEIAAQDGWEAMSVASYNGHIAVVAQLLSAGVNVNRQNSGGGTALHNAAYRGHDAIVQLLLSHKASPILSLSTGWTPLQSAVGYGFLSIARLLIRANADVEQHGHNAYTPLGLACRDGHCDVAELLIKNGASVDQPGFDGFYPLSTAANHGHPRMIQLLLDHGANVNSRVEGWTALMLATAQGHDMACEVLIKNGASSNDTMGDVYGADAIHLAINNGQIRAVKALLCQGIDVHQKTKSSWTPLALAVLRGHEDMVKLLTSHGAGVNQISPGNESPLMIAALSNRKSIAEFLIASGADISHQNGLGNYPIHFASRSGHPDLIEVFLSAGADVNQTGGNTLTPLLSVVVAWSIKLSTGKACIRGENEYPRGTIQDQRDGYLRAVRTLLDWNADPNARDQFGRTALHYATLSGDTNMTECLLDTSVDLDIKETQHGWTASHVAAAMGNKDFVQLLLKSGADPGAKTDNGELYSDLMSEIGDSKNDRARRSAEFLDNYMEWLV